MKTSSRILVALGAAAAALAAAQIQVTPRWPTAEESAQSSPQEISSYASRHAAGSSGVDTSGSGRLNPDGNVVQCANLVYAGNKASVCFSDRFLKRLREETNIETEPALTKSHLGQAD